MINIDCVQTQCYVVTRRIVAWNVYSRVVVSRDCLVMTCNKGTYIAKVKWIGSCNNRSLDNGFEPSWFSSEALEKTVPRLCLAGMGKYKPLGPCYVHLWGACTGRECVPTVRVLCVAPGPQCLVCTIGRGVYDTWSIPHYVACLEFGNGLGKYLQQLITQKENLVFRTPYEYGCCRRVLA